MLLHETQAHTEKNKLKNKYLQATGHVRNLKMLASAIQSFPIEKIKLYSLNQRKN